MKFATLGKWSMAGVSAVVLAACSAENAPTRMLQPDVPSLAVVREPEVERVEICKDYVMLSGAPAPTSTVFTLSGGGQSKQVTVPTGGCVEALIYGGNVAQITVSENVPGFTPSYIQTTDIGGVNQTPVGPVASNTATGYVGGTGGPYGAATGELFEFTNTEEVRGRGCTVTLGYWKTHSSKGPAPYDNAWLNIGPLGEDTPFFVSGQTWYQVFWTSPKKGNANYILAHQYMAAKLNILAGASSTPAVDAAITGSEAYFATVTNLNNAPTGSTRTQLLAWADLLDDYNNGVIGPGHC